MHYEEVFDLSANASRQPSRLSKRTSPK